MLFANEEGVGAAYTWIAVAIAGISLLGTVTTGVIALLNNRDKLRFDRELSELRLQLEKCEEERTRYESQRTVDNERINSLQERADRAERAAARAEGENAGLTRELSDVRADVRDLRQRIFGGGGGGAT